MADDSILDDIKKLLGMTPDYTAFDIDIQIFINSAFGVLHSIGATPKEGFAIRDRTTKWSDYLDGKTHVEFVKSYIYLKTRVVFDPPTGSVLTAYQEQIKELEFRLSVTEFDFNPDARDFAVSSGGDAVVFDYKDGDPLPKEMEEGDLALDPATGNLWRKG